MEFIRGRSRRRRSFQCGHPKIKMESEGTRFHLPVAAMVFLRGNSYYMRASPNSIQLASRYWLTRDHVVP
ncbi:MAG: hypothetical protein DMG06_05855 [Acidobacteria bacterium]|nr:MAG: hypothetical protein DMG06_05855 [Acidobacteriota bacterium]